VNEIEMDLLLANIENAMLKVENEKLRGNKCRFHDGYTVKLDGVNELDPCIYEVIETHKNVTVEINRCQKCGHIEITWRRQDDTEDGDIDG
jgi:hypothetical protein